MQTSVQNSFLETSPDAVKAIRQCWGLDKPGDMEQAVTILKDWAKQQPHFLITGFDDECLDIAIISSKGSIERAKSRIDKYCTFKTMMPKYFEKFELQDFLNQYRRCLDMAFIPKYSSDYNRLLIIRYYDNVQTEAMVKFYKYVIITAEYLKKYDYYNGITLIFDFRLVDLIPFLKKVNFVELREAITILIEGFAVRVQGIHLITESKVIEMVVNFLKQVLKPSISSRIRVHKNEESIYDCVNKEILPVEYGGKEKPLKNLHDNMKDVIISKGVTEYIERLRRYGTDEKLRPKDQFNDSYIGMPGTFRALSVD